jgi:hypothetical protein
VLKEKGQDQAQDTYYLQVSTCCFSHIFCICHFLHPSQTTPHDRNHKTPFE